jgi:hypothetical protein
MLQWPMLVDALRIGGGGGDEEAEGSKDVVQV